MPLERLYTAPGYAAESLYEDLTPESAPAARPYIRVNMVATADGKTLLGPPGSTAKGLGGPTDQLLMRRIQAASDAAIIGAGTLRVSHVVYDPRLWRVVVTASGDLPKANRFFTDAPQRAVILCPQGAPASIERDFEGLATVSRFGGDELDLRAALAWLRTENSIRTAVLEGGAALNAEFLALGLIDELFLTIAPKLKGGANLPSIIDGAGLPGADSARLDLLSVYRDTDELYLRYAVRR